MLRPDSAGLLTALPDTFATMRRLVFLVVWGLASASPVLGQSLNLDLLAQAPFTTSALLGGGELGSFLGQSSRGREWEPLPDGRQARSFARRSTIDVRYRSSEAEELTLLCGVPDAGTGGVRVSVLLNGRRLGIVRFSREMEVARFPLNARRVRPGVNRIEIKKPAGDPATGTNALVCSFFGIGRLGAAPRPALSWDPLPSDGGALVIEPGQTFEVFLRHPAGARFSLELCRGSLKLVAEHSPHDVFVQDLETGPLREIAVPGNRSGFARLELVAGSRGARICRLQLMADDTPGTSRATRLRGPERRPRNLLLIIVDTLRADRLGVYGDSRGLTPSIDALAAQGLLFENVVAQSAWTSPATASILTGTNPTTHGIRRLGDTIAPSVPSLAKILAGAGFSTAAITTNINVRPELGFDRGFASYRYLPESDARKGFYAQAEEVQAEASAWLDRDPGQPFFLYLHLSEPHAPYAPAAEARARFAQGTPSAATAAAADPLDHLSNLTGTSMGASRVEDLAWVSSLYDAEVATVDAMLGQLRKDLEARGLWETTLVVLTSDHGEAFGEHGFAGHGYSVFSEEVQVPLIFGWGGEEHEAQRAAGLARQIDVLPTILDLLGVSASAGIEGVSLMQASPREAFTETRLHRPGTSGLILDDLKVVRSQGRGSGSRLAVYDLGENPAESKDVIGEHAAFAGWAEQELRRRDFLAPITRKVRADPSIESRLKMLGYVE